MLRAFKEGTGLEIRDGYGQTETGQLTGMPAGGAGPARLDGPAAARHRRSTVDDGELVLATRRTDPTFFVGYLDGDARARARAVAHRRPGPRDEDGYLYFEGRTDDVIISAGYRIGPFEVESALVSHPAVAEAAVVAAPDDERGAVSAACPFADVRRRPPSTSVAAYELPFCPQLPRLDGRHGRPSGWAPTRAAAGGRRTRDRERARARGTRCCAAARPPTRPRHARGRSCR